MTRTTDEIIQVINNFGYRFIGNHDFIDTKKVDIEDSVGYKYRIPLCNMMNKNQGTRIVDKSNPYSLENISLWLNINNKNFILLESNQYKSNGSKILFYCYDCQDEFYSSWSYISQGCNCSVCHGLQTGKYHSLKYLRPDLDEEWDKSNKISSDSVVIGSQIVVSWVCRDCKRTWKARISSRTKINTGCPYCSGRLATEDNNLKLCFPNLLKEWDYKKNGNPENYTPYSCKKAWWICSNCTHRWKTAIANRTQEKSTGCPKCKTSHGERIIKEILDDSGIFYDYQETFPDCRDIYLLKFDFYLPSYNLCIEYNGEQHYEPVNFFGGKKEFIKLKLRDKIKQKYCKQNKIKLIIIPYTKFNQIESILKQELDL